MQVGYIYIKQHVYILVHRAIATVLSILNLSIQISFELAVVLIAIREIYFILLKGDAEFTGSQELCSALLQQNRAFFIAQIEFDRMGIFHNPE